jgi:hypothetical protein
MSLLKQLLSPFVEFDDKNKKETATPTQAPQAVRYEAPVAENVDHPLVTPGGSPIVAAQQPAKPSGGPVTVLPEHLQYFEKLIETANLTDPLFKGTDYKEFSDSKLDIDNITDEETRYKTAFNVLKRTGLTKERLLSTAQEYHNLIGRDLNAFQGAHKQQYQKEVLQREQLIQKKAEELQALSLKMNELKKDISQLSQSLTEIKDKMNITKNSFLLAGENMQNEIQNEIQKIEKYF